MLHTIWPLVVLPPKVGIFRCVAKVGLQSWHNVNSMNCRFTFWVV